ncbi:hypothetical protein B0H13DRAFT_2378624 [Mycena leptocephala]|nr:hypothetical protein B0H13DRAFT_2378624 [Mycena leptocephala]
MPSAPAPHVVRNPGFHVQLSRRRVVKSKAIKASDNLRLAQSRKKRVDFQDAIDAEFERRAASITSIAATYSKKPDFVRTILCSLSQFKNMRAPTLRNAVVHQRALDYQAQGISKKLHEIRAELQQDIDDGAFSLDTIEDEEATRLLEQLLEHRKLKRKGARATTKAAQTDAKQTTARIGDAMSDLQLRTGVCGVAFFSRGNADDPSLPNIVDSDDAMDFLTEVLQISPLDFLRKFEQWVVTREGGNRERNGVNDVRKDVSTYIQDGLRKITNNPNALMEYMNYDVTIREAKGVELAGVPTDVKVDKRGDWNVETGRRVHEMLRTGAIHWVKMTKSQHEALIAELNAKCEALGAGALKKRKPRSDKDQPRGQYKKRATAKSKNSAPAEEPEADDSDEDCEGSVEKETEGVQATPRADSAVLAPGAGAGPILSVAGAIPANFAASSPIGPFSTALAPGSGPGPIPSVAGATPTNFAASSTIGPFTGSSIFAPSYSFDLADPDKVPDYNPALNNLSFDLNFPVLGNLDPALHLEFDPALLQLLQDGMATYNPDHDTGTLHAPYGPFPPPIHSNTPLSITAPDAVRPLNPTTTSNTTGITNTSASAESSKRKRGPEADNDGVAQPAKKGRKKQRENAPAAQSAGEMPAKKPRKPRSDKDKPRGPRKSKTVAA